MIRFRDLSENEQEYWVFEYIHSTRVQVALLPNQWFVNDGTSTLSVCHDTVARLSAPSSNDHVQVQIIQGGDADIAECSVSTLMARLTSHSKTNFIRDIEAFMNKSLEKQNTEGIAPTMVSQLYLESVKGQLYYVKHTGMMVTTSSDKDKPSYRNTNIKRGAKLAVDSAYMGKRKGMIICFRQGDSDSIVEIPFSKLSDQLEKGKELQLLLVTKPSTKIVDTDLYQDRDDFGVWA